MSNLVKNGYFTNLATPIPSEGYKYMPSTTYITDWTFPNGITGGSIVANGTGGFLATSLPTGITQYYGIPQAVPGTLQGITQTITFPKYGTGTLSFWISKRYGYVNLTQSITVSLASIRGSNSRSYNKQDTLWYYETIPFTITNANDLIQTLSISATSTTSIDLTVYISGISIDYVPFTEMVQTTEFVLNGDIVSPKLITPTSITAPTNWLSGGTCSVSEFYDGGYLTFNGINQYGALDLSASYAYPNGTVECRFRTIANPPSSNQTLVAKQSAYALFVSASTLVAYIFGSGQVLATGILVNDGNWHHVAFSFQSNVTDGSKLYLDGVLVKTATCSITDQTGAYRIGALTYGEYFNGSLDDVRIWSTVLSGEQIIRNYNSKTVSNTSTGLAGYWRLDEASGTTATNSVSGGVNFTLYNNPTFTPIPSSPITSVGLPKTLTQYVNIVNNGSVLYQYINLVTEGNFILSFWARNDTASQILTVAIEPLVFTTFTIDNVWRQYTFNFTVLKYQINQLLRFQISSNFTARLTGISIRQLPVLYYIQTPELVQNGNMTSSPAVTDYSANTAPTSWWKSNANTGLIQRSAKVTTGLPSTIPQLVVLFITGELYQSITFNTIGNYVLSFWMGQNPDAAITYSADLAVNVSLGTILTNSTTYTSKSEPWKQVILPFTISSPNTTATLKFSMTGSVNGQQVWFTGVSIIAASVTNGNFDSPVVTTTTTSTTTSSTFITNWTGSGSNGWGQGNFTNPVTNKTGLSSPSSILQYAYINKNSYLSQTIPFSAAGNYILTFWASSANTSVTAFPSVSLKVDIGTSGAIFSKTFDYISNTTTTWTRYSVSFSVVSGSLTQPLTFTNNSSSADTTTQIRLTSISITDAVQTINAGSGNITTTGVLSAGNITTSGTLSAGTVTATGALTAGSVSTTGALTAGTLTVGTVTTSGALTAGTVTTSGPLSAGTVTTSGALSAGSVTTTGALTAKNISITDNSTSGLSFRVYTGYHGESATFFDNNNTYYTSGTGGSGINFGRSSDFTSIATATNNYISNSGSEDYFSVLWTGYFKPDVTGTWTFRLQSDDYTYIWLGNHATSAYTIANCDIKDTADAAVPSTTFTLTAGVYYPIRIQYGEIAGGVGLILYMTGPTGSLAATEKTNGTGLFFSDIINSFGNIYTNGDINTTNRLTTNRLTTNQLTFSNNVPRVSVYRSTDFTFSGSSAQTTVIFNALNSDYNNLGYSTTTGYFTPPLAGFYMINTSIYSVAVTNSISVYYLRIYKNTEEVAFSESYINSGYAYTGYGGKVIYLNGSTDYIKVTVGSSATTTNFTGKAGQNVTCFQATYLGSK